MKFIHSADWQLGKPYGRFEPDVRGALTEARFDAVDALGKAAVEHGAQHVLVAGDIFDTEGPEDRTIVQAISRMDRYACRWWLLPGNHDFARNGGLWDRIRQRAGDKIVVLSEPEPQEFEDKVWLLPAPLLHRHNLEDPTTQFDTMETPGAQVRIGVAHGSIRDFGSRGETKNQIAPDRAKLSNLDYLALGDWHGSLRVDARTWYSGTPETDRFQRDEPGQALVVEIQPGHEPVVTPIRTGRFRWLMREWTVNDQGAFDAECDHLLGGVEAGQRTMPVESMEKFDTFASDFPHLKGKEVEEKRGGICRMTQWLGATSKSVGPGRHGRYAKCAVNRAMINTDLEREPLFKLT